MRSALLLSVFLVGAAARELASDARPKKDGAQVARYLKDKAKKPHKTVDQKDAAKVKEDAKKARSKVMESAHDLHNTVKEVVEGKPAPSKPVSPSKSEKESVPKAEKKKESTPPPAEKKTASPAKDEKKHAKSEKQEHKSAEPKHLKVPKDFESATTALHNAKIGSSLGSGAPAPALMMRAPAMAPAPAPVPVPAPLTYEEKVAKMKGDMMKKIKGDSFDADLIIERPNKVKPGEGTGKEHPVPEFKDVGNDFGPYAKKPKALKHDDIAFKTGSLPADAAHVDRSTMTSDWHMEYGPNGPKGMHGTSQRPFRNAFQPLQPGTPGTIGGR